MRGLAAESLAPDELSVTAVGLAIGPLLAGPIRLARLAGEGYDPAPLRRGIEKEGVMRIAVSFRMVVLFGVIVALPLLALPVAARLIDERLNGTPPADLAAAPLLENSAESVTLPVLVERISPATADPASAEDRATGGLDVATAPPEPPNSFDPLWTTATQSDEGGSDVPIDEATIARLQRIRERLEELGADYVIVETTDVSGRYRFHCRMIVEDQSPFTRPFEAVSADPLAAGEQVLQDVESWRLAAVDRRSRQK